MSHTNTLELRAGGTRSTGHSASLLGSMMNFVVPQLRALDRWLGDGRDSLVRSRAQLLRLAQTYESSQPSYAADLRAAADRAEPDHDAAS
ncbi:MAG: hypothetical protein OEY03_01695 [Rhizobacter sp.]|nr:hypothetical protein [Rhizobacter sp.]